MRVVAGIVLLLCTITFGQVSAPVPDTVIPQRKELLRNSRVTASLLQLAPSDSTPLHKHTHDMLTVVVSGGKTRNTVPGAKPSTEKLAPGEVRFHKAGYNHSTTNVGAEPFSAVTVEFADAQGSTKKLSGTTHTCTPDKKACVEEKKLFCTEKVCVEDVVMAPGSSSIRHTHSTDHLIVAVSDFELSDEVEGKGTVLRTHKSGEVEFLPAGITHRLTNKASTPARFTIILWR